MLQVWPATTSSAFELDAVLAEKHERCKRPARGDVHSWLPAKLVSLSDAALDCSVSGSPPARDATGTLNCGTIDVFCSSGEAGWWIMAAAILDLVLVQPGLAGLLCVVTVGAFTVMFGRVAGR